MITNFRGRDEQCHTRYRAQSNRLSHSHLGSLTAIDFLPAERYISDYF
jgi:hypothetical protein